MSINWPINQNYHYSKCFLLTIVVMKLCIYDILFKQAISQNNLNSWEYLRRVFIKTSTGSTADVPQLDLWLEFSYKDQLKNGDRRPEGPR